MSIKNFIPQMAKDIQWARHAINKDNNLNQNVNIFEIKALSFCVLKIMFNRLYFATRIGTDILRKLQISWSTNKNHFSDTFFLGENCRSS